MIHLRGISIRRYGTAPCCRIRPAGVDSPAPTAGKAAWPTRWPPQWPCLVSAARTLRVPGCTRQTREVSCPAARCRSVCPVSSRSSVLRAAEPRAARTGSSSKVPRAPICSWPGPPSEVHRVFKPPERPSRTPASEVHTACPKAKPTAALPAAMEAIIAHSVGERDQFPAGPAAGRPPRGGIGEAQGQDHGEEPLLRRGTAHSCPWISDRGGDNHG